MIADTIEELKNELPSHVKLVVVSKFRSISEIMGVYHTGQRAFAENRIQNLLERKSQLPEDIEWHMIGQLQSNKVKYIAPFISMIHSLDGIKLAREIQKNAEKNHRSIDCLLQIHIAKEETKSGILPEELDSMLQDAEWKLLNYVNIRGVMAMASNTSDNQTITNEFNRTKAIFLHLKSTFFKDKTDFDTLSMGMSGDYHLAIPAGSTLVRIGSKVFE